MRQIAQLFRRLADDQSGGEVIEYALVGGLIVVAAVVTITGIGTKVLGRWNSVNSSL